MQDYKVDTGGRRNEAELTEAQINAAIDYAVKLNMPRDRIRYAENNNVSYGANFDWLYLGTDLYPAENAGQDTKSANSRISWKGALAHELIGHREAKLKGLTQENTLFEEAQASIRAARFAPDLSETERITLLRDAVYRLNKNGFSVSQVKHLLNIKER
jgi:hypothetical protein